MRKAAFSFCVAVNSPLNSTLLTKYALCSQGRFFSSCMAKKDNLVPRLPQQIRQTEKVGFRTAVHIKVFVYKQYLHAAPPYLRRSLRTAFRSGLYSPTATSACVTRSFMPFSCTIY